MSTRYIQITRCRDCPHYKTIVKGEVHHERDAPRAVRRGCHAVTWEPVEMCESCSYSVQPYCPLSETHDGRPKPTPTSTAGRPVGSIQP